MGWTKRQYDTLVEDQAEVVREIAQDEGVDLDAAWALWRKSLIGWWGGDDEISGYYQLEKYISVLHFSAYGEEEAGKARRERMLSGLFHASMEAFVWDVYDEVL